VFALRCSVWCYWRSITHIAYIYIYIYIYTPAVTHTSVPDWRCYRCVVSRSVHNHYSRGRCGRHLSRHWGSVQGCDWLSRQTKWHKWRQLHRDWARYMRRTVFTCVTQSLTALYSTTRTTPRISWLSTRSIHCQCSTDNVTVLWIPVTRDLAPGVINSCYSSSN